MSTATASRTAPATQGKRVCQWIEKYLVHGEGDFYGQPFRLRRWQRRFIYRLYEHGARGGRRIRRALWGLPKGSGKTELLAAIALYELLGDDPVFHHGTPDVVIAAASFDQADLLFGAAKTMVTHDECPLGRFVDAFDTEIVRKDKPGTISRVAAAAGTNDGKRPSALICDELHEWTGNKRRVHTVLENGLAKRADSVGLYITTAGVKNSDTVCEEMYTRGRLIESGEAPEDDEFLFEWWEANTDWDLADDEQLFSAIREANPAADDFWPADRLFRKYCNREIPEWEFRRYHLNQWTDAAENSWIEPVVWDGAPERSMPDEGETVSACFDGSKKWDTTGIVVGTGDRVCVWDVWERPHHLEPGADWEVPRGAVKASVDRMMRHFDVQVFGCDPSLWWDEVDTWQDQYGEEVVISIPLSERKRWAEYCDRFYADLVAGELGHDFHPTLRRHVLNAVPKETTSGTLIAKTADRRHIDLAWCAVGAHGLWQTVEPQEEVGIRWL